MTASLRDARSAYPGRGHAIVEMGPGTGAVTRSIAAEMGPDDTLDCYEIDAGLAAYLRRTIQSEPAYAKARERIHVHCLPAQKATSDQPVDLVICSVPFNNLEPELVESILRSGLRLLHTSGSLTYFGYTMLPRLRRLFATTSERVRIDGVTRVKNEFARGHLLTTQLVLANVPPARTVTLRPSPSGGNSL